MVIQIVDSIVLCVFSTYDGDIKTFLELSLAGSVIMMLSFLAVMVLNYKYHKYGLYCLLAAFPFAVFLLLIGMGLGSQYVNNISI
jgi:hypothetical protein